MRACVGAFVAAAVLATTSAALALDHGNLDHGRPLALEDPFPIAYREWNAEIGVGFTHERRGSDRGLWELSLLHGAALDTQVGLETTLSSDPRSIHGPAKSGDLAVTGLHNFSTETLTAPALGVAAKIELPTGVGSRGVDGSVKALVLKSVGRLGLHYNLELSWTGTLPRGERRLRHTSVGGGTWPLGAPLRTRLLLLGDIVVAQAAEQDELHVVGAEAGLRYQWSARAVLDAGIGADLFGADERAPFRFTMGLSGAW